MQKRSILAVFAILIFISLAGCTEPDIQPSGEVNIKTYKDIPGVTQMEIIVINELQDRGIPFIYAVSASSEIEDAQWYTGLLCEWLASLFDMQFRLEILEPNDIFAKLETGEVDFTNLVFDTENKTNYFLTEPIIHLPKNSAETGFSVRAVSIAAKKPELAAVITIINKALENGGIQYINDLYNKAHLEYSKYKFRLLLNDDEKAYLRDNPIIPFATQYFAYPNSFYNKREKKWDGIIFDLFPELEELTGLSFELVHDHTVELPETIRMLENGKVFMIPNLVPNEERKKMFLQSEIIYMSDRFALLSKRNYPNVELNDIPYHRVGLVKGSAFTGIFRDWFPAAANTKEYSNIDNAFIGLDRDEVDMVMSSKSTLTSMNNYYGFSAYKANFLFDAGFDFGFWFNKEQELLKSILDKALPFVNTEKIVEQWMTITYNYEELLLREQRPWLIGAIGMAFCVIILIIILFKRNIYSLQRTVAEKDAISAFQNIIGELDLMVHAVDPKTHKLLFMNDYMRKHYKIKGDYAGKLCYKLIREGMEGRCSFCPCNQLDEDPKAVIEWEELNPRTNRFYRNTSRYINWIDGRTAYLHHAVDITDMKYAVEQSNAASRAKSDFLSQMSHEMRTPMNAIIGMTTIGKNADSIERKDYVLKKIESASSHLLGIINDILDMTKIEANKLELSPVEFDFEKMVQKTVSVISYMAEEKNQKLIINVDKKIPKFIYGDDQRLSQVITNLLSNAVKFTPKEGEISLTAFPAKKEKDACELKVEVTDTGIGIAPEHKQRIFQPFEQAESGTSRKFGGTGLGLVISKKIVELMEGKIWVESELGKGSKFIFTVKVKCGKQDTDADNDSKETVTNIKDIYKNKKLLLAEDIEINREILLTLLEETGIKIDCAENGEEALEKIKNDPARYDIIFMDVQMPKMDGLEATRLIREIEAGVPIIAMTANVFKSDIEECLAAGMNDHLGKPLDFQKVLEILNRYLLN